MYPLLATLGLMAATAAEPPVFGAPARLFALPAINEDVAVEVLGRSRVALSDFTGTSPDRPSSAVVLFFFEKARGGPQLADLHKLQKQWSGRGVQVLGISADRGDLGALSTWLEGQRLAFPVLRDNHGVVLQRYGFTPADLPLVLVVGGDGALMAAGRPEADAFSAELDQQLAGLVGR
jgi:peroxiredoxin